jgi:hypothetical protein
MFKVNHRVTDKSGKEINHGDDIVSFRGEAWTFGEVTRGVEYNGTAKVTAIRKGGDREEERYAGVWSLTVETLIPELTGVSDTDAFGVEWVAGTNGNTYRLTNPVGKNELTLGVRHAGKDRWHSTSVHFPERWMPTLPTTHAEFAAAALAYIVA